MEEYSDKSSTGQLPPTPPTPSTVVLNWTAPANCTGCTYVVSAVTVTTTTCPVPNVTTPNYTPINPATPLTATTVTETPNPNTSVCYIAQTKQNGLVSQPSNTAGPFVIGTGTQPPAAPSSLTGGGI
jgi:hypothetical protein